MFLRDLKEEGRVRNINGCLKREESVGKNIMKSMTFAIALALVLPSVSAAFQRGLKDPETGLNCNQQAKLLKHAGADVHPHHLKKIREILKRCEIQDKKQKIDSSGVPVQNGGY